MNHYNLNNKICFFEAVASHNLERFHSETIAWIFNTFPDTARHFILKVHYDLKNISDIKFENENEFCWAEQNQIDILLKYSYNEKNYQIIIENKIKASEHQIEIDKLKIDLNEEKLKINSLEDKENKIFTDKEIEFITTKIKNKTENKLSQTEFYYLREKLNRSKEIYNFENEKNKSEKQNKLSLKTLQKYIKYNTKNTEETAETNYVKYLDNNFNQDYCRYVFLKPSKIQKESFPKQFSEWKFDKTDFFEKLNSWSSNSLDNPWVTLTYQNLVSIFNEDESLNYNLNEKKTDIENKIIARGYIDYIKLNIKEDVDLNDFNNNNYGKFDYFKLLMVLIKSKFKNNLSTVLNSIETGDKNIYEYIEAGSSNGGMPLFAFYKKIKIDADFPFFNKKREYINIGIQVQGNNLKYYVSADNKDYNETKIKEKYKKTDNEYELSYGKFVKSLLLWITDSIVEFPNNAKGFNPNKTKTFYSRSYKIDGFMNEEKEINFKPKNIFEIAFEISEKVNHFLNLEIQKGFEIAKKNILE